MPFVDRFDAGRQLAASLRSFRLHRPVVVGLARGGVPVAFEVARALDAPMEVWIARKIRVPADPELTVGAISEDGAVSLNKELVLELGLPDLVVALQVVREAADVERQTRVMRGGPRLDVAGRSVILVDDAIQTGATVRAAARSILARKPRDLVLAVPGGAIGVMRELEPDFDRVVWLEVGPVPVATSALYGDLWRVSEADVASLMTQHERERGDEFGGDLDFESETEPARGA